MPCHYDCRIRQTVQPLSNGLFDAVEVSSPKIGAPDTAAKERVAGQHEIVARKMKTHGAGGMARGMERNCGDLTDQQFLLILEPIVRQRHRRVYHTEHPALQFKILPQLKIVLMQTDRRPRRLFHFTGGEEMIEVGMGMENVCDRQPQLAHLVEDPFVRPAWIDDDCLLRHRITDDRAIAAKGRNGKCFSDERRHHDPMLPSNPIKAQAAGLRLFLPEPEWSKQLPYRTTSSFVLDGDTI
jgi:hypothetical protein